MQSKIFLHIFLLFVTSEKIFAEVAEKVDSLKGIPFKPEHTAVNEATSNLPYIFLVLILFSFVLYFLSKKTGVFKALNIDKNDQNSIKILQMKKISPNTVFFKIKIDDSEYMFLESKNSLQEIKPN